jgi:hypothetical protein
MIGGSARCIRSERTPDTAKLIAEPVWQPDDAASPECNGPLAIPSLVPTGYIGRFARMT